MVVITSDHGGNGTGHGGQDDIAETRYVWFVVRTPGLTSNLLNQGVSVDLLPTMLEWMQVPIEGMPLDSAPLY